MTASLLFYLFFHVLLKLLLILRFRLLLLILTVVKIIDGRNQDKVKYDEAQVKIDHSVNKSRLLHYFRYRKDITYPREKTQLNDSHLAKAETTKDRAEQ